MIQLGCCAFSFSEWSLEDSLRLVRDLGFRRADIGLGQVGGADAVSADPARAGARIRAAAEQHGIELCEFFLPSVKPAKSSADGMREATRTYRALCRCAAEAGLRSVMGGIELPHDGTPSDDEWLTHRVDWFGVAVEIAGEFGLQVNTEPGFGTPLVKDPEQAVWLADKVPGLGYTLDLAHFMAQGRSLEDGFKLLPHTRHVHGKQAAPGMLKSLWHNGRIDYRKVVQVLKRRAWDGVISLECMAHGQDPELDFKVYQEIDLDYRPRPAEGLVNHPAFQVVPLAYELDRYLRET